MKTPVRGVTSSAEFRGCKNEVEKIQTTVATHGVGIRETARVLKLSPSKVCRLAHHPDQSTVRGRRPFLTEEEDQELAQIIQKQAENQKPCTLYALCREVNKISLVF